MIKIKQLHTSYIGIRLPDTSRAGSAFEKELAKHGHPVDPGQGPDYPKVELEVKTKSKESRSANVIGTMSRTDIINTPYEDSSICKKMKQQLRIETEDGVIVKQNIYDFSADHIQEKIKESYEIGQKALNVKNPPDYVNCNKWGYFEKRRHTEDSYMYRINVGAMKKLEGMAKSSPQYKKFFSE